LNLLSILILPLVLMLMYLNDGIYRGEFESLSH